MHRLSEIDKESRTAICIKCGPVKVTFRKRPTRGTDEYTCQTVQRERDRRYLDANRNTVRTRQAKAAGMNLISYEETWNSLYESQNGKCAICLSPAIMGQTVLDHNHETGNIRGLLCHSCNRAIGMLGDTEEGIKRAYEYLKNQPRPNSL